MRNISKRLHALCNCNRPRNMVAALMEAATNQELAHTAHLPQ